MEDKHHSNSLQIVLIVSGVLVGLCLICLAGSYVISRVGQSQTERLTTLMVATYEQSGRVPPNFRLPNDFFNPLGTFMPTNTHRPALTIHPYDPSTTPNKILPESASCVPGGEQVRALMVKVISGDTIQVVVREQTWLVKYIGVRSPQMKLKPEPLAIEAAVANQNMLENQVVVLMKDVEDVDPTKTYMLRYVFAGDLFLNDEMVRRGFASTEPVPPNIACSTQFQRSQQYAIDKRLGLWIDAQPSATLLPSATIRSLCDCQGQVLSCDDFPSQAEAQTCLEACMLLGFEDIFNLDNDGNDIACDD
jgi:endonuclease YncB( thermonuclease family)